MNPSVSTFGTSKRDPDVPRHVAIVMDGNGRWAKKRFMPRIFGHKHGVDALVATINACANRGVEHLTVFAFSSENWKRPEEEVSGLMGLVLSAMTRYLTKIAGDGVRVKIIGDRNAVSQTVRNAWERAEATTAHNTRITVWVAFNYGGRWDIVQACQRAIQDGVPAAELQAEAAAFERHHGGRAPRAAEVRATPARHHAAAIAGAEDECEFKYGWENDDAVGLVNYGLRDIVGNIHDFFHHLAGIVHAVTLFGVGWQRYCERHDQCQGDQRSVNRAVHSVS